eukprot:COSAG02_NODE_898_length_16108_cov_5.877444_5_plen_366_part_00
MMRVSDRNVSIDTDFPIGFSGSHWHPRPRRSRLVRAAILLYGEGGRRVLSALRGLLLGGVLVLLSEGTMAFQSPRSAQLGRSSSLTLSVASPTPSLRQPVGTPRRLSGAVLPADRSAASRRELNDILAQVRCVGVRASFPVLLLLERSHTLGARQLDTPRTEGGHGSGYDSPRGRQPVTAGGSLNESKRSGIAAQFPVQTTSPMSVLNAGSSKTVSQIMQEHSYASPRAGQVGRSSSTSVSSPRSSSRGLVGTHRSVTPPPSQGELEDIGNDLKRMLATPVESPRREPLNIEPPPERADLQLVFTIPAAEPEPEPEREREPLQVRSTSSVAQQIWSDAASCCVRHSCWILKLSLRLSDNMQKDLA